ncbi:unnamed protein product [Rhizoctonia solani]|nr:unnamed protein product [Rhizoctonia solani]
MGLRLTNLKDLREDANSGLKRFWALGQGTSKAGNMKPIEEESDTDSELELWEVDSKGEPMVFDGQKTINSASTSTSSTRPPTSSTNVPAFKQSRLPVSRGSVPLEKLSVPKRKRSVSVGANMPNKSSRSALGATQQRHESSTLGPKTTHKIIIDVDSLCPGCLQEIGIDSQHSANCSEAAKGNHLADRNTLASRVTKQPKQPKLPSLFNRKRS